MKRRPEAPLAHARHDQDRAESIERVRAAGLIAVLLAALLAVGSTLHAGRQAPAAVAPVGLLPSVSLTSNTSVAWDCPGPLPAGSTSERSAVIVVNPAPRAADVIVDVAATTAPATGSGTTLPGSSTKLVLPPRTEQRLALPTAGPAQEDAVSVVSIRGAVAVFEVVTPAPPARAPGRKHAAPAPVTLDESPCAVGTSRTSYLATGSTLGTSNVLVAVYDPTATEAVVGLSVSTGTGAVAPPALQGLIVKPDTVQVFDIGRSVVQQPTVAVTASTTVGRVVVGAFETQAATQNVSGQALVLSVQRSQSSWTFAPGPLAAGRITELRLYDPGPRAATVTITSPVPGHAPLEITVVVPGEGVRAIALPLPGAPAHGGSGQKATTGSARVIEGPIVVRSAQSVGIVVARVTAVPAGGQRQTMTNLTVTSGPATEWVLPIVPVPASLAGLFEISNPGSSPTRVAVAERSATGGRLQSSLVRTVTVGAGATVGLSFRNPSSASSSLGALFVDASAPVVVEQDSAIVSNVRGAAPSALCVLEGIPVRS